MFERYTERARRVIFFARYEASSFGSPAIDTEHMLLGLLREDERVTRLVFSRAGLTYEAVQRELQNRLPEPTSTAVDLPLSSGAKAALQHAAQEATGMGSQLIDNPHLLLGLLSQSESLASDILNSKGVYFEDVREDVRLRSQAKEAALAAKDALRKLAGFLARLDAVHAAYHVSAFREDGVRVDVGLTHEKWVATFFADGRVTVEAFLASGTVEDDAGLTRLIDRIGPPKS